MIITKKKYRTVLILLTAAAATLLAAGCGSGDAESAVELKRGGESKPVAVRVRQPEYRTLERRMSYVGTVFAHKEVKVTARLQGTLAAHEFEEGESFTNGAVLARLAAPEVEAALERAESERDYWCTKHETDARLVEQGAIAPEQAQASERACRSARAGVAEAKAQLDKSVVAAPFAGELLDWLAEPGQPLMPGQPIVLIGDPGREIRVDVVEEDLVRGVTVGTAVEMQLGPGHSAEAAVGKISPLSSGAARTFTVTIPVPAGVTERPRKGGSVHVDFILERQEESLSVPERAVKRTADGSAALYSVADGTARREKVSVGVSEGGWVGVEFDWNGVDPVAVTNLQSLSDGTPVFAVAEERTTR